MQRARIHDTFEQDLKEAISWLKKTQYEMMLAKTHDEGAVHGLDQKIRVDSQLTWDDKAKLLAEVNGVLPRYAS